MTAYTIDAGEGRRAATGHGTADWLCLAATPTFAVMALLTGLHGNAAPDMICSAGAGASPMHGMAWMYALMSAFHAAPWLRAMVTWHHGR